MEPVLMVHPNHGWMHAYNSKDIEDLIALGWAVDGSVKKEPVVIEAPKRGRPRKAA